MAGEWITFIEGIKDEAGILVKDELFGLIRTSAEDSSAFVRKQTKKVERYFDQLATGAITKDDFERYMRQIQRLTEMETLKLEVMARASAQRLADGIQNLILDRMLKLLP